MKMYWWCTCSEYNNNLHICD